MTEEGVAGAGERVFRLLHGVLVAGVVAIGAAFAILAQHHAPPSETLRLPLRLVASGELVLVIVASLAVRRAVAPLAPGADRDAWWAVNGPRVLVLWALAEGTALLGAAFWYLSGDFVVFAALMGTGLTALVWSRPGRISE